MRRLQLVTLVFLAFAPPASAQDFPRTFPHMFGETTVPATPERVVSLGYSLHDDLLALGVVPVGLRHWFGDHPRGVWPWAEAALGDADPVVLRGEVSLEQVAALAPDLILAMSSGITAAEYAVLSQIAPTIASQAEYGDFSTPWDVLALTVGQATGREDLAREKIDALEARFADIRAANPDWEGRTAVAAYTWANAPAAFRSSDSRAAFLTRLGFQIPQVVDDAPGGGSFYAEFSPEDLSPLDADLVVWVAAHPDPGPLRDLPLRRNLKAHAEGREVYADPMLAAALSHSTLLSLPQVLDRLVPEIAPALDGDPATPVPSAVAAGLAP